MSKDLIMKNLYSIAIFIVTIGVHRINADNILGVPNCLYPSLEVN